MSRKNNYRDFLKSHKADKAVDEITNTSIKGQYGGNFHIPNKKYKEFLKTYYREVISKGSDEFLTEKQMETGPIAVDLDFRYNYDVDSKQYNISHIKSLMLNYLDVFKEVFQFESNKPVAFYVFEKPNVNRIKEKGLTKDGIHMIIGIHCNRQVQQIIRSKMIERISEEWDDLPLINTWNDVFDEGISKGTVNWQLYGSKKPDHESYALTHNFEFSYDPNDGEFMEKKIDLKKFNWEENLCKLSVRYSEHPEFFLKNDIAAMVNDMITNSPVRQRRTIQNEIHGLKNNGIFNVKNHDELDCCVQDFMKNLTVTEYDLLECHEYASILPESYYGNGSYEKWIRVGWALRNMSDKLFVSWVQFSAKSSSFNFNDIPNLYEQWCKFESVSTNGLKKGSIIHWARNDADAADFKRVKESGVKYFIDQSIRNISFGSNKGDKNNGCGDSDLAKILHMMFKDKFACASIKGDKWYRFVGHRYVEDEQGTTLRHHISEDLRSLYRKKGDELSEKVIDKNQSEESLKKYENLSNRVLEITVKLGRTTHKDHIMKEAKEVFYDPDLKFLDLLDSNPYLMCFNNGVLDMKNNVFRCGRPDDYLEKCTNINYIKLEEKHKPIIAEINDFMEKLFPREQLRKYMWEHLASILLGVNLNQKMHIYIGAGSNGKSVLTDLLSQCLGDYYAVVPISLITQQRQKQGSASPDIIGLRGLRMAVMQEPSKNDQINDGAMKELTSGVEPIKGRQLHSVPITFVPQCKFIVCSNNFMKVNSQDHGTWRRIAVVDFESRFTDTPIEDDEDMPFQFKVDPVLKDKFPIWKEVFMSMLVDIIFRTNGSVCKCKMVDDASLRYKNREDHISEFISERVILDPNGRITKTEVNTEFSIWYQGTYGRGGPTTKEVHEYLDKDKRFSKYKTNLGAWIGARIRYDREMDEDDSSEDELDATITPSEI